MESSSGKLDKQQHNHKTVINNNNILKSTTTNNNHNTINNLNSNVNNTNSNNNNIGAEQQDWEYLESQTHGELVADGFVLIPYVQSLKIDTSTPQQVPRQPHKSYHDHNTSKRHHHTYDSNAECKSSSSVLSENYSWICDIEWNGESVHHIREGLSFMVHNIENLNQSDFFYDILKRILFQTRHDLSTREKIFQPVYEHFTKTTEKQWPNIICDGCSRYGLPLLRYKCSVCDDYDLCPQCFYHPPTEDIKRHIRNNYDKPMSPKNDHFAHEFLTMIRPDQDLWIDERCAECLKMDFAGIKFTCTECEHYILCQGCYASVSSQYSHMHKFKFDLPGTEAHLKEKELP